MRRLALLLVAVAPLACTERVLEWNRELSGGGTSQDDGADSDGLGQDSTSCPSGDCDDDGLPDDDDPMPDVPGPDPVPPTWLYANTATSLFAVDPITFETVDLGLFQFSAGGGDQITDIAIDRLGVLYAVGTNALYACDATTIECVHIVDLPSVNAAGFVPPETPGDDDKLYVAGIAGDVWHVELVGSSAQVQPVGNYGIGGSSGDIASSSAPITVASIGSGADTTIWSIDPDTAAPVNAIAFADPTDAWGLAYYQSMLYAFSPSGQITAGTGPIVQTGISFWGASSVPGEAG